MTRLRSEGARRNLEKDKHSAGQVEASATASTEVNNLNVFNGEITATDIVAQAHATARAGVAKGRGTTTAARG